MKTLHDLFVHQLQDAYSAETQLIEAMPLMAQAVGNAELKAALQTHLAETQQQKSRCVRWSAASRTPTRARPRPGW